MLLLLLLLLLSAVRQKPGAQHWFLCSKLESACICYFRFLVYELILYGVWLLAFISFSLLFDKVRGLWQARSSRQMHQSSRQ